MKIISQIQAQNLSLKFYFTGRPCKRSHIVKRHVSGGECSACRKLRQDKLAADGRAYMIALKERWAASYKVKTAL